MWKFFQWASAMRLKYHRMKYEPHLAHGFGCHLNVMMQVTGVGEKLYPLDTCAVTALISASKNQKMSQCL